MTVWIWKFSIIFWKEFQIRVEFLVIGLCLRKQPSNIKRHMMPSVLSGCILKSWNTQAWSSSDVSTTRELQISQRVRRRVRESVYHILDSSEIFIQFCLCEMVAPHKWTKWFQVITRSDTNKFVLNVLAVVVIFSPFTWRGLRRIK